MSDLKLDTSTFNRAIREYAEATKKDMPDILNRAGRNLAYKAVKFTPAANAAAIKSDLMKGAVLFKVLNHFRILKGKKALGGKKMSGPAKSFLRKKTSSAKYIKVGWFKAIMAFGGNPSKSAGKLSNKGLAAKGYGKKATKTKFIAELANFSRGASKVGAEALQKAIYFVADDMAKYAQKRMAETAAKHSAR